MTNAIPMPRANNYRSVAPLESFALDEWLTTNADRFLPPISNETMFKGNDNFIVMASGGPNLRKDFHYNESEELFLQLRGTIQIKLMLDDGIHVAEVHEGDLFLVPPKVIHSPIRPANTLGVVIEKHREIGERDGFMYFCEACNHTLYAEYFFLEDIVSQVPMVTRSFFESIERRTCSRCGTVMDPPDDWADAVAARAVDNPYRDDPTGANRGRSW